jgi:hypothetical protein
MRVLTMKLEDNLLISSDCVILTQDTREAIVLNSIK